MNLNPSILYGVGLPKFRVRTLTNGPLHHFFGYYGMSPWNKSETTMVCLESSFQDRMPEKGEEAAIGLVDPGSGDFSKLTTTKAWNLQQGAMIHWNPLNPDKEFIFNDNLDGELQSISINIDSGKRKVFPRPLSAIGTTGKHALSLTYGRLARLRKVVGYAGTTDPYADQPHPAEDGVFLMDLETGKSKLVVSIQEVFERSVSQYPALSDRHMWFNHTVINPGGTRFLFLARTRTDKGKLDSAMFTANMDGSDLHQVIPFGSSVSHFGWRNDQEIIATYHFEDENRRSHVLFTDGKDDYRVVGKNVILDDGHCTFSPDGRWMATDRKEYDRNMQSLWLFDMKLNQGMLLASLQVNERKYLKGNTRCDFHPRWNPSGNKICFDGIDTASGTRQMHLAEFLEMD
jgi:hypothetical protein